MMAKKPKGKQQAAEEKARNTGDKKLDGPNRPAT
jgi:small acid-soluble spore protein M (minor)